MARTTVHHVTDLDRKQLETAEIIKAFDEALSTWLRDPTHELPNVVPGSSFSLKTSLKMASQLQMSPHALMEKKVLFPKMTSLLTRSIHI